jgi:hypothetical protein
MNYSGEQIQYIEYCKKKNTKLIACAGSGKTFCIIMRINHLLTKNIYQSNQILMLTFSRFTCTDFINKLKKYNVTTLDENNIRTIDSFAKEIIDTNGKNTDVNILSYSFMKHLEQMPNNQIPERLKQIETIFIDEAQDLNHTQYRILELIREKTNCTLNLIGDPNQNIFQFRNSSDKYLLQFPAKTFHLTVNYRSYDFNVDFSKHLRPYQNMDIVAHKKLQNNNNNNCRPMFFCHDKDDKIAKDIIEIIKLLTQNNIDGSNIAILSPTRGYLSGATTKLSKGLCLIANILTKENIPFSQFYDEASEQERSEINYHPKKNHINLITFTGSKGLEWDYVILLDSNFGLTNEKLINEQRHIEDQYLLYVACSRAIKRMFIFSTFRYNKNYLLYKLNPWFSKIPSNLYSINDDTIEFASQNYPKSSISTVYGTTEIIDRLQDYEFYQINQWMHFAEETITKLYPEDFSSIETPHTTFLGKLAEFIFHYQYQSKYKKSVKPLKIVIDILSTDIIGCNDWGIVNWYENNKVLDWKEYDLRRPTFHKKINNFVKKNFSRDKPFDGYKVMSRNFYDKFILNNKTKIKNHYDNYLSLKPWNEILDSLFYMVLLCHSIKTSHYFHIETNGKRYKDLIDKQNGFYRMFEYMDQMITNTMDKDTFKDSSVLVTDDSEIIGEIDLIGSDDSIYEIKCTKNINLRHKLQLLIYNYLFNKNNSNSDVIKYKLSIYNLLSGIKYETIVTVMNHHMEQIINLFQKAGNISTNTRETQYTPMENNIFSDCLF